MEYQNDLEDHLTESIDSENEAAKKKKKKEEASSHQNSADVFSSLPTIPTETINNLCNTNQSNEKQIPLVNWHRRGNNNSLKSGLKVG